MPTMLREWMPPEAPLARPIQRLNRPYRDANAPPGWTGADETVWRALTFGPAILLTVALVAAFANWFGIDGLSGFETVIIGIVATTVLWIAISVSTSCAGILGPAGRTADAGRGSPCATAGRGLAGAGL